MVWLVNDLKNDSTVTYTCTPVTWKKPRTPMIWACLWNKKYYFTSQAKKRGPHWLKNCLVLILLRGLVFLILSLNNPEKSHESQIQKSVLTPKLSTSEICLLILWNRLQKWHKPINANSSFPNGFTNDLPTKFHEWIFKVWTRKTTIYFKFDNTVSFALCSSAVM